MPVLQRTHARPVYLLHPVVARLEGPHDLHDRQILFKACRLGLDWADHQSRGIRCLLARFRFLLNDVLDEGRSNREIAAVLLVSARTVENHVTNVLARLGVMSRTCAVTVALRVGLAYLLPSASCHLPPAS